MQRTVARSWSKPIRLGAAAITLACAGIYTTYDDFGLNQPAKESHLNPTSFTPFTIISRERVSETNSILTLRGKNGLGVAAAAQEMWKLGVWSVEVKQPQLMIARRYTPLPPSAPVLRDGDSTSLSRNSKESEITLLVRREPQGEVSRYLHAIPVGAAVEVRGGYLEYGIPEDVTEVLFLAGGTGIAPALQVARVLSGKGGVGKMTVLWASRRREECAGGFGLDQDDVSSVWGLSSWWTASKKKKQQNGRGTTKNAIVSQLDALSSLDMDTGHSTNQALEFKAHYFVDEEGSCMRQVDINRALKRRSSSPGRGLIIISGPDGFVEYLAGPKRLVSGVETQGRLGGLLSKSDLRGWQVWKL